MQMMLLDVNDDVEGELGSLLVSRAASEAGSSVQAIVTSEGAPPVCLPFLSGGSSSSSFAGY